MICKKMLLILSTNRHTRVTFLGGKDFFLWKHLSTQHQDEPTPAAAHPPAALPLLSMATSAMDPTHGAAPPHESCAGARGRGSFLPLSLPLIWAPKGTHQLIERWAGLRPKVAAIMSTDTTTNRRSAAAVGGGGMMRCARVATRGEDSFLSFWAANGATKKRERDRASALGGRPLA